MKTTILALLLLLSFKSFATETGEDQKSPCTYANQSSDRNAKVVIDSGDSEKPELKTAISK